VIAQQFDGLAIGRALQKLQQTHAHQQDGLDPRPAVVRAISFGQCLAGLDQQRVNDARENGEAILRGKKRAGQSGGGKEAGLRIELRKAHSKLTDASL